MTYAPYVWSSFLITAVVLALNVAWAKRRLSEALSLARRRSKAADEIAGSAA